MIAKLDKRLKDKDMGLELTPAPRTCWPRGYDPVLGARPLRRTIQREIEDASEKILFGETQVPGRDRARRRQGGPPPCPGPVCAPLSRW
jgi:ATP-dependent Clp protease ATP-binding subunit ClpA